MSTNPTRSRFYLPVLNLLREKAPQPMGVSEIIATILSSTTENRDQWVSCNGGVRAMLLRMSQCQNSPIRMVNGSNPPKFYVEQAGTSSNINSATSPLVRERIASSVQINSIFLIISFVLASATILASFIILSETCSTEFESIFA